MPISTLKLSSCPILFVADGALSSEFSKCHWKSSLFVYKTYCNYIIINDNR